MTAGHDLRRTDDHPELDAYLAVIAAACALVETAAPDAAGQARWQLVNRSVYGRLTAAVGALRDG